ncbi:hypothetical protein [Tateyamaria pelophila]|uniref:hypothetical protein n=1 Tax=Tateyamaria pelophila TaxID=328415 RepID=UPI001CBF15E8|nr:hypothetical protein [Tateyamaria pelophila]
MSYDTLRVYEAGRFHDVDLPDWYYEACRIGEMEGVNWHRALERVLDCEYRPLTEEGLCSAGLEIRFWRSAMTGTFVLIETPLVVVEQIVVIQPEDFLPFLSNYLAPLMAASAQYAVLEVQGKIANAFIAWARHGDGSHIDRETGLSQIDLKRDLERRRLERLRETQGGVA